jgi:hypothetical protein
MSEVQPSRISRYDQAATVAGRAERAGADAAASGAGRQVSDAGRPPSPAHATGPAEILRAVVDSREFLDRYRAAHPSPADPDRVQAAMMRRGGIPSVEHYARVFRAEGMSPAQATREAQRMVEADRELLARYPAR